jgi:hypothetical protein
MSSLIIRNATQLEEARAKAAKLKAEYQELEQAIRAGSRRLDAEANAMIGRATRALVMAGIAPTPQAILEHAKATAGERKAATIKEVAALLGLPVPPDAVASGAPGPKRSNSPGAAVEQPAVEQPEPAPTSPPAEGFARAEPNGDPEGTPPATPSPAPVDGRFRPTPQPPRPPAPAHGPHDDPS